MYMHYLLNPQNTRTTYSNMYIIGSFLLTPCIFIDLLMIQLDWEDKFMVMRNNWW